MNQRKFSPRCGNCRQRTMVLEIVEYTVDVDHDGRKYRVSIPKLSVPKCSNCGAISIDDEADKQIDAAFRQTAKLLTLEQIREGRERLALTQQKMADLLDIAVSTLSRWETGAQVQQRGYNRMMEAFFEVPEFRKHLAHHAGVSIDSMSVVS
jgi:putative zinc finger/helix-turn-helix YgiT family protein